MVPEHGKFAEWLLNTVDTSQADAYLRDHWSPCNVVTVRPVAGETNFSFYMEGTKKEFEGTQQPYGLSGAHAYEIFNTVFAPTRSYHIGDKRFLEGWNTMLAGQGCKSTKFNKKGPMTHVRGHWDLSEEILQRAIQSFTPNPCKATETGHCVETELRGSGPENAPA